MSLTTIVLVPVLVASVVLLFSFVGCVIRVRFRLPSFIAPGPHLHYRPGVSGIQSVEFRIVNTDSMRRDRLVLARGTAVNRLPETDPDPGPMFRYSSRFTLLGTGEAVHGLGVEDLATPTTGNFVIRCRAFTTPDATGMPLADTATETPPANVPVTRRTVDGRPDPVPSPSFRLLPDFPPLPGEPSMGVRAGEPSIPYPAGNTTLILEVNPAPFGSRPPSANFTITPTDGTPRTVIVTPGAVPPIPAELGSGASDFIETDTHITFYLQLVPATAENWTVTVSASRITSAPATVRVDPDPEKDATVHFRAHPWDGESGMPTIAVQWTDGA